MIYYNLYMLGEMESGGQTVSAKWATELVTTVGTRQTSTYDFHDFPFQNVVKRTTIPPIL